LIFEDQEDRCKECREGFFLFEDKCNEHEDLTNCELFSKSVAR